MPHLLPYTALTIAVLSWGLSFVATKIALASFTPFSLIFLRFFFASLILSLLFYRQLFTRLDKPTLKKVLLLALFQPVLYFSFETIGLQYTTATTTSLIIATIPLVVLGLSSLLLKEKLYPKTVIGILLSFVGVAILVLGGVQTAHSQKSALFGDLLIFGAVLAASGYMILAKKLSKTLSPIQITGLQMIFGTIFLLPLFAWDLQHLHWHNITNQAVVSLIGLTLFATIVAFLCYNYALTAIPTARVAICINGIPIVTAIAAWLFLGEMLTYLQFFGGGVVLIALLLANRPDKK